MGRCDIPRAPGALRRTKHWVLERTTLFFAISQVLTVSERVAERYMNTGCDTDRHQTSSTRSFSATKHGNSGLSDDSVSLRQRPFSFAILVKPLRIWCTGGVRLQERSLVLVFATAFQVCQPPCRRPWLELVSCPGGFPASPLFPPFISFVLSFFSHPPDKDWIGGNIAKVGIFRLPMYIYNVDRSSIHFMGSVAWSW